MLTTRKIEGEVKLQQEQNEKHATKEETSVPTEDAEDIRKTIAFMKHSLSINTRELERYVRTNLSNYLDFHLIFDVLVFIAIE